jgi:hypothetical protein
VNVANGAVESDRKQFYDKQDTCVCHLEFCSPTMAIT